VSIPLCLLVSDLVQFITYSFTRPNTLTAIAVLCLVVYVCIARHSSLSWLFRDCFIQRGRTFRWKLKTFSDTVCQPNLRYSSQHIQLCYSVLSFSTNDLFTLSTATARNISDTSIRIVSHLLELICRDENVHSLIVDCMISTNAA